MSPVSELLIRKLWRQASSNFTVSLIDLNKMERSEGYHPGSPSFAFYCSPINYGGRDVLPLLHCHSHSRHSGEFCGIEICLLRAVRRDQNTSAAIGTRSRSDLRNGTSDRLQGNAFI
jgi:hypothetical protein